MQIQINRTNVEVEAVYNCLFCGEEVYKCDNCGEYLLADTTIHDIFCDTSYPNIKHYCIECGEDKQTEATQDGTTDGIPPKPKDLGILPTII